MKARPSVGTRPSFTTAPVPATESVPAAVTIVAAEPEALAPAVAPAPAPVLAPAPAPAPVHTGSSSFFGHLEPAQSSSPTGGRAQSPSVSSQGLATTLEEKEERIKALQAKIAALKAAKQGKAS